MSRNVVLSQITCWLCSHWIHNQCTVSWLDDGL